MFARVARSRPVTVLVVAAAAILAFSMAAGAQSQSLIDKPGAGTEGPPPAGSSLPRYVSLRSDEVNLRTGPGVRYPVDWVLQRRHMPVEVLAEFENWRKIRDWQGTEGWVHQSMLSGRRYAIVTGETRALHRQGDATSPAVARLEPGVVAQILECKDQWCRIDANGFKGWLTRPEFWGVYPSESVK
jgi:SH3-like domain-containing protein